MKYGPIICIAAIIAIIFVLWAFIGGKNYEFVGLNPLIPETSDKYTGSIYNWGLEKNEDPICINEQIDVCISDTNNQICCKTLSYIYGIEFAKSDLGLSCYNDDLKLAVEYYDENQEIEQICSENNIYLIKVPSSIDTNKIPEYIVKFLPEIIQQRIFEEQTLSKI